MASGAVDWLQKLLSRNYSKGQPRMDANGRESKGETHGFHQRVLLIV